MIAGGAHVYAAALPLADEQILTEVHRAPAGDTFYPAFDRADWVETAPRGAGRLRLGLAAPGVTPSGGLGHG